MKINIKKQFVYLLAICLMTGPVIGDVANAAEQSKQVTLTGEINDTHQLVADGKIYDIHPTPAGDDLVLNYISQKVKVIGTLRTGQEIDVITVRGFEVVGE